MKGIFIIILIVILFLLIWFGTLLFMSCNPTNQKTQEEIKGSICAALPTCYKNIFTRECRLRGCGYSPYTAPGSFWIQTFVCWSLFAGQLENWNISTTFIYYIVLQCVTMETISVRFEENLLHDIKQVMKEHRYATKTEFIREAVRDKITDLETEKALLRLDKLYGSSKRKTTPEQMKKAKEEAFEEIARRVS